MGIFGDHNYCCTTEKRGGAAWSGTRSCYWKGCEDCVFVAFANYEIGADENFGDTFTYMQGRYIV